MVDTILNSNLPFGIAPTSADRRVNSAVEFASLMVAEELQLPFVLNLFSAIKIEEVAEFSSKSSKWLEFYPFRDHRITESLVRKVEEANFRGIIVSTNETEISFFPSIERIEAGYKPVIIQDLIEQGLLNTNSSEKIYKRDSEHFWDYTKWLTRITNLPIMLKGNFAENLINRALQAEVSGLCFTDPCLREISDNRALIGNRTPLVISGDVICEKLSAEFLKHGVDMVLIERPTQWGFTIDGQKGIEDVVRLYENANK